MSCPDKVLKGHFMLPEPASSGTKGLASPVVKEKDFLK